MKHVSASLICEAEAELGEGSQLFPDGSFRFVDLSRGKVFRLINDKASLEKSFNHEVSKALPWNNGQVILGRNFIHLVNEAGKEVRSFQLSNTDSNLRCSDGCVLPDGSLLVGILDMDLKEGAGSLLHISNSFQISEFLNGTTIPNGAAVMPGERQIVWVDSPTQKLVLLDIGNLWEEPKEYFEIDKSLGVPDGLTVDSDGGIWVAMWGGGKVVRISPGRTIDLVVDVGCKNVTSCCFDQDDNLLITTARAALTSEEKRLPGAGGIWAVAQTMHGFRGLKPLVSKFRHN